MCSQTLDNETSFAWKGFLFSLNSCARQIRQPSLGTPYPISLDTYLLMRSTVDFSPHSVVILAGVLETVSLWEGNGSRKKYLWMQTKPCHHPLSTKVSLLCIHHGTKNTEEIVTGGQRILTRFTEIHCHSCRINRFSPVKVWKPAWQGPTGKRSLLQVGCPNAIIGISLCTWSFSVFSSLCSFTQRLFVDICFSVTLYFSAFYRWQTPFPPLHGVRI